jgi:hypothetical protein
MLWTRIHENTDPELYDNRSREASDETEGRTGGGGGGGEQPVFKVIFIGRINQNKMFEFRTPDNAH